MKYLVTSVCVFVIFLQGNLIKAEKNGNDSKNATEIQDTDGTEIPSVKDFRTNISTENSIFEAMFKVGSRDDLLKIFDPVKLNISDTIKNQNFILGKGREILFYNITAYFEEPRNAYELDYFFYGGKMNIQLDPSTLVIESSFQCNLNNTKKVSGKLIFKQKPLTLVKDMNTAQTTVKFDHSARSIRLSLDGNYPEFATLHYKLKFEATLVNITNEIISQTSKQLAQHSTMISHQFEKAFPFLPEVLSSRLNGNHFLEVMLSVNKTSEEHTLHSTIGPMLLQGLNNFKRITISVSKETINAKEYINYAIQIAIEVIRGQYDMTYISDLGAPRTTSSKFSINNFTLIISPHHKDDAKNVYRVGNLGDIYMNYKSVETYSKRTYQCDHDFPNDLTEATHHDVLCIYFQSFLTKYLLDTYALIQNPLEIS